MIPCWSPCPGMSHRSYRASSCRPKSDHKPIRLNSNSEPELSMHSTRTRKSQQQTYLGSGCVDRLDSARHVSDQRCVILFLRERSEIDFLTFVEWRVVMSQDNAEQLDAGEVLLFVPDVLEVVKDDYGRNNCNTGPVFEHTLDEVYVVQKTGADLVVAILHQVALENN